MGKQLKTNKRQVKLWNLMLSQYCLYVDGMTKTLWSNKSNDVLENNILKNLVKNVCKN